MPPVAALHDGPALASLSGFPHQKLTFIDTPPP